ncbi:hypothetical protein RCC89_05865 [Cytophagaceae bacterium ABcell3]|nr:hypothetical protein RCC89_05865 [Cytophagaceae bacterium ABcell3]
MPKIKILLCLFLLPLHIAFAQEDYEAIYDTETIGGLNLNTNAGLIGGVTFRHSIFIKERHYHTFGAEIVNVRHPQEERRTSFSTGNSYVYGKENYMMPLRLFYGRTYILFPKDRDEGVQIDLIVKGGPSLGLLKPYYVLYDYSDRTADQVLIRSVPFNHQRHRTDNILGHGSFFSGIGDTQVVPGVHFSTSLMLSFMNFNENITGVEAGFNIEAFPRRMNIIPTAHNRWLFSSVFINIVYGRRR